MNERPKSIYYVVTNHRAPVYASVDLNLAKKFAAEFMARDVNDTNAISGADHIAVAITRVDGD